MTHLNRIGFNRSDWAFLGLIFAFVILFAYWAITDWRDCRRREGKTVRGMVWLECVEAKR